MLIYKRPSFWAAAAAVALAAGIAVGLLLNPKAGRPNIGPAANRGSSPAVSSSGGEAESSQPVSSDSSETESSQPVFSEPSVDFQPISGLEPANNEKKPSSGAGEEKVLVYRNTKYGFTFNLPLSWKDYTIVLDKWKSNKIDPAISGPVIRIRNSKWTASHPYADIPFAVFTHAQWNAYLKGQFRINAFPGEITDLPKGVLGENNRYVFSRIPRWEADEPDMGLQEVIKLMALDKNPLHAFDIL